MQMPMQEHTQQRAALVAQVLEQQQSCFEQRCQNLELLVPAAEMHDMVKNVQKSLQEMRHQQ